MKSLRVILIVCCLNAVSGVFAGKLEKGFECLKIFNYFEAKRLFISSMKKNPSPAAFGLAIIYARNDNPFYNLDSAYFRIQQSLDTWKLVSSKQKEKWKLFGFDSLSVLTVRQQISTQYFQLSMRMNTEGAWQHFIVKHPWAEELNQAIYKRDSIAFSQATHLHTSKGFSHFIEKYPTSQFASAAKENLELVTYQEQTASNTLEAYVQFINQFPTNPYKGDAEDRVFALATEKQTIENLEAFIRSYSSNRNLEEAWRKLYQLYMYDYSEKRIAQFLENYPDYPFKSEVELDRSLSLQQLFPYKSENLFGWMNEKGEVIFPAEYESLGFFNEGLSLAAKNGRYGYIDKANHVVIPFQFDSGLDFESGRAIVEKQGKFGIIDRSGKQLFDFKFTDLGPFSEGLIYGSKDSMYAYYDKFGMKRIDQEFQEAFSFVNGMAKVKIHGKEAFVDPYGKFIVEPKYQEVSFFTDSLLLFQENNLYGLQSLDGTIVLPAMFDEIGQVIFDKAIVVKNSKIGYINAQGMLLIQPTYELFANYMENAQFKGSYAKAKWKEKYGIIDASGKWVILPVYSELGDVSGMISFAKAKKWGFIDLTNKVLVKPIYTYATSIISGTSIVEMNGKQGVINPKGEVLIPIEYDEISRFENDYFVVVKGNQMGLFSSKGLPLVPVIYDQIKRIDANYFLMSNLQQVHYFHTPSQTILSPKIGTN